MTRAVAGALLAAAAALGCAQPGSPPGGPEDRSPPRVVEVRPAAFDTLTDLRSPVLIRFDERISERLEGVPSFREAVLVSPATGEPRVDKGRSSLEIIPEGGWVRDRVYRVVVLPVFRDLFGNRRVEPIELVFSTGAPIAETAVAGFVEDRITGERVAEARVEAVSRADGVRHVAVTDTGGFFALRFLPSGAYDVQAWLDQDRDREIDFFEGQDSADAEIQAADTVVVQLALLPGDTTPARLARAEPIDSARVRLLFDDHFAVGPVDGSARLFLASDSSLVADDGRLIHSTRLDSILAAEAAVRDSLRAEQMRQDSLRRLAEDTLPPADTAAARDTVAVDTTTRPASRPARAPRPAQRGGLRPPSSPQQPREPLPSRELVLVLPRALVPDTAYYVVVEGVVNIRGVPGGGGTAPFRSPPPDTTAPDTVAPPAEPPPPDTTGPGSGG